MEKVALESIHIKGSHDEYFTPTVDFNAENGVCSIAGESYLENSFEFYDKLIDWMDKYIQENDGLELNFKLTYFNTSSSRAILDILKSLKEHQENEKNVIVNWYYPEPDDNELKLEGEDFIDESELEMNLIEYPENN